jgi:hypothetical protein
MDLLELARKKLELLRVRKASALHFKGMAGVSFLRHLANFCRANETCIVRDAKGNIDRDKTLVLESRREVWLMIQQHFNLSPTQLLALYDGSDVLPEDDNDE